MTRHCHNCGADWMIKGQPGRGEICMTCRVDLRACLNCVSYDPHVAHQCRERRAEPVLEKSVGNFCEYFDFARRAWKSTDKTDKRADVARETMKKLFGD